MDMKEQAQAIAELKLEIGDKQSEVELTFQKQLDKDIKLNAEQEDYIIESGLEDIRERREK